MTGPRLNAAWPAEKLAELKRLAMLRMSRTAVAAAMGVSYNTAAKMIARHGLAAARYVPPAPPEWPPERVARLRRMRQDGLSFAKIAEALGCTKNAAIGACHRHLPELVEHKIVLTPRPVVVWPEPGHCLWGFGDPLKDGFRFCGSVSVGAERAWCREHRPLVYSPVPVRRAA